MKSILKIMIDVFFMVSLLVFGVQNVIGLGVSPASKVISFEPGLEEEFTIMVVNSQNKSMNVEISKEGELGEYVNLGADMIEFSSDEREGYFNVSVKLPEMLGEGDHVGEIVVTEIPIVEGRILDTGVTGVTARVAVVSKLIVRVPYVGRYAEAGLELSVVNGDVYIFIPVSNIGTEDIAAKARIRIFGEEELDVIETEDVEIKSLERGRIRAKWSAPSIGSYRVFVEVYYDDKVIELEEKFEVGEMFVKVDDVLFDKIKLGEVVGFDIIVSSGWNDVIKDVYADVWVRDNNGGSVARLRTASSDIDALSKENLRVYWDTKDVSVGIYDFVVTVNYGGKIAEKIVEVNVEERAVGISKVEEVKPSFVRDMIIAGAVLIIIFLVVVIWYLWWRRND